MTTVRPSVLVAVDQVILPVWHLRVIERLLADGTCKVSVLRCPGKVGREPWLFRRLRSKVPALKPADPPGILERYSWDGGSIDALVDLRSHSFDNELHDRVGRVPRARFISGHSALGLETVPFVGDIARRARVTEVTLQVDAATDGSVVLRRGRWRTSPERFTGFVQQVMQEIVAWPAQSLPRILSLRSEGRDVVSQTGHAATDARVQVSTSSFLWGMFASIARMVVQDLVRHEYWTVGIAAAPIHDFLEGNRSTAIDWRDDSGHGCYLADPFGVVTMPGCRVLVERFDYRVGRGEIARLTYEPGSGWSKLEPAFHSPMHLSYPLIVDDSEHRYALPECSESGQIALYEVSGDLSEWGRAVVLIEDFSGVDGTVFRWEDRWWLIATNKSEGQDSHLYAWYSDRLLGPWTPHSNNPIKIDVSSARPGGTPFQHNGKLYRPAQDCSKTYGGSLVLLEVQRLDPHAFEERVVRRLDPPRDSRWSEGLHTISRVGDTFTLFDAKRTVFSPYAALRNLKNVINKSIGLVYRPGDGASESAK